MPSKMGIKKTSVRPPPEKDYRLLLPLWILDALPTFVLIRSAGGKL